MKRLINLFNHLNIRFFKIILLLVAMIIIYIYISLFSIYLLNKNNYSNIKQYTSNTELQEETTTTKVINDTVSNILNNYPELKDIIEEAKIPIPIIDGFIPQGITLIDDNILITGYYEKNKKSKCYVLNNIGDIINVVELDTNSHVGSIAYDEINNLIWIPDDDGVLNAYDSKDFLIKKNINAKLKFYNVSDGLINFQNEKKNLIAYLDIDGKNIYIGNFFIDSECTIKKYEIVDLNGTITLKYINSFKVPSRIQGLDFINVENKKYMILSRSYRRRESSSIQVYEYKDEIVNYNELELVNIKIPPMLEQISIKNNSLYLLFESNATKYWNCPEKMEFILKLNTSKLLKNLS